MDVYSIPLVFKEISNNDVIDEAFSNLLTSDFMINLICALIFLFMLGAATLFKKHRRNVGYFACFTLFGIMLVAPCLFYEQAHAEKNNEFSNLGLPKIILSSINAETKEVSIDNIIIKNLSKDEVASIDSVNLYTENQDLQCKSISITLSDGIESLSTSNSNDIDAFKPFKDTVNIPCSDDISLSISAVINEDLINDILQDSSTVLMLKVNSASPKVIVSNDPKDYESNIMADDTKRIDFYFDGRDYDLPDTLDIYSINSDDSGDIPARDSQAPWTAYQLANITTIEVHPNFRFLKPKNTNFWFSGYAWAKNAPCGLNYIDTSETENMMFMFTDYADNSNISEVPDVSSFNTSKVKNMQYIFSKYGYKSHKLTDVPDVSNWDTSKCKDLSYAFESYAYKSININQVVNVSKWNTSNVKNMSSLFKYYACSSQTINVIPDVSNFDTENCTDFSNMFAAYGESSKNLDKIPVVDKWNTSNAINFSALFQSYGYHSNLLKDVVNVSNWNTQSLKTCKYMFNGYGFDSPLFTKTFDVSKWDTSHLVNMNGMFMNFGTKSIGLYETPNIKNWNLSFVENMSRCFFDYGYLSSNDLPENKICPKYVFEIPSSAGKSLKMSSFMFACLINNYHSNVEKIIWNVDLSTKEVNANQMFANCYNLVGGMGTKWDPQHIELDWARIDNGVDRPGYFSIN